MTADPRIVPEARTLATISFGEVAELSYVGAKVLHPKTIAPVYDMGIPVRVLNSMHPERPGTLVAREATDTPVVKGITAIRNLSLVTVEGRGMQGVTGVAGRVFSAVARSGANILMITQSSSEQSICFVVRTVDAAEVVRTLRAEFELELMRRDIDDIARQDEASIVAVVGAGMRGKPGIAAAVFGALGDAGINIISIAQGSSEYNLSLVTTNGDVDRAVLAIHSRFRLGQD
jgi:aspartate kinase